MKTQHLMLIAALAFPGLTLAQAEENASETKGCLVERVEPGSPAEVAGVKAQDVILAVNRAAILSAEDLQLAIQATTGDVKVTVRREGSLESLDAHVSTDTGKAFRLGVLCAAESYARLTGSTSETRRPSIYIGFATSRLSLNGDFDGRHILYDPDHGNIGVVPSFDDGLGLGGVLGFKLPLSRSNVDLAWEVGYQQGSMDNSFMGISNEGDATLRELSLTFKSYFFAKSPVQPVLGIGFDAVSLDVQDGIYNYFGSFSDKETFRGYGWHIGGGVCWYIIRQLSVEAFLGYHWRRFETLNGHEIDNSMTSFSSGYYYGPQPASPLKSASFEPSIVLRYHFSVGRNPAKTEPKTDPGLPRV